MSVDDIRCFLLRVCFFLMANIANEEAERMGCGSSEAGGGVLV